MGLSLDKAGKEVLGTTAKVVLTKETTTIVGDGSTQEEVNKRVAQIRNLIEVWFLVFHGMIQCMLNTKLWTSLNVCLGFQAAEQEYEKEKLNERIAKLSGGVAVIQVMFILSTDICF